MSQGLALLRILADGRFHSGEQLGACLDISRAGVWKRLRALKARGFDIHSVRGRGHRLAQPVELLAVDRIRAALPESTRTRLASIEIHDELDSTSSTLLERAATLPSGTVCLAEAQRRGRGRQGRVWHSPCARNLYLSLLWRFPRGPEALGGLSLVVGLAVLQALADIGVGDAGIKWPNDILRDDAKLAGVLIELSGESGGASCVVIGIGINVDMAGGAEPVPVDQPWTDIVTATGSAVSRNLLAALVLQRLTTTLDRFQSDGLAAFLEAWRARDLLLDRQVVLHGARGKVSGIARGIDSDGALLLEQEGLIQRHHAGDISLRAASDGRREVAA